MRKKEDQPTMKTNKIKKYSHWKLSKTKTRQDQNSLQKVRRRSWKS